MRRLPDVLRTAAYVFCFVSFFAWLALRIRGLDRFLKISLPAGVEVPGIVLMFAGGLLAVACVGTFVARGKGTPAPFDTPREFVVVGPYRYVCNPMYIGGLLLVGFGMYELSVSFLLMALVLLLLVHLLVIYYEEPTLRRSSGSSYENYCGTTARWIPALVRPTKRARP